MKIKIVFFTIAAVLFAQLAAAEVRNCDTTSTSEETYKSVTMRLTFITGVSAQKTYESIAVPEESPIIGTFPAEYVARAMVKAKYSEHANCWKVRPPLYVDGVYSGVAGCEKFSCNLIEKF